MSQNHVPFLAYLSSDEWDAAMTGVEAATQTFLDALLHRLGCTHADEYTLKRVAAASLTCAQMHAGGSVGSIMLDVKLAQLRSVKQQYQKMARKVKASPPEPPLWPRGALPAAFAGRGARPACPSGPQRAGPMKMKNEGPA